MASEEWFPLNNSRGNFFLFILVVAQTQKLITMATYLIQNNVAHFYNREDVTVWFPNSETVYTNEHSLNLINSHNVKKVNDIPFKLNTEFIRYEEDDQDCITEFDLLH